MLAGGPQRTTRRRRYPFLLKQRCGVLVHEGVLAREPDGVRIGISIFTLYIPYTCPLLHLFIQRIAEPSTLIEYHQHLIQSSGKRGTRRQRLHIIPRWRPPPTAFTVSATSLTPWAPSREGLTFSVR